MRLFLVIPGGARALLEGAPRFEWFRNEDAASHRYRQLRWASLLRLEVADDLTDREIEDLLGSKVATVRQLEHDLAAVRASSGREVFLDQER
jgi:hypothetical protein